MRERTKCEREAHLEQIERLKAQLREQLDVNFQLAQENEQLRATRKPRTYKAACDAIRDGMVYLSALDALPDDGE